MAAFCLHLAGCVEPVAPVAARDPKAEQFFQRANEAFVAARVDDAHDAVERALALAPKDDAIRTLAGEIALSRLEYDETLRFVSDVKGPAAQALRARAYWYLGQLGPAADELDALQNDPAFTEKWAKDYASLAHSGAGRTPFHVSGHPRAAVEMAQVSELAPYLVVPLEIDGENGLALVSTTASELVVDRATHAEPSWVSIRFRGAQPIGGGEPSVVDVSDVPALVEDLSGIGREVNAPVKALIGMNLLRRLNVTLDYGGRRFVIRNEEPSPPPNATRVPIVYGPLGEMFLSPSLGGKADEGRATVIVDTTARFPIALDEAGWSKAGISTADLEKVAIGEGESVKQGILPVVQLGAFDLKKVPGILGTPVETMEKSIGRDIDGIFGVPLVAFYRVTFGESGRVVYLEDDSELQKLLEEMSVPAPAGALDAGGGPPTAPSPGTSPVTAPPVP